MVGTANIEVVTRRLVTEGKAFCKNLVQSFSIAEVTELNTEVKTV